MDYDERISDACRTILLSHGEPRERAVILFHGLTASPPQFRRYARALYERGHNVLVPLLPLHGFRNRMTESLAALTEETLRSFASGSLETARVLGRTVTVAGFSAGGTLALWLAQNESFDRAVAIAPFLGAAGIPRAAMDVMCAALLRLPNWFVWWDPIRRERQQPDHGYPRYPTHALARLYRVSRDVLERASSPPRAREVAVVLNRGEASVNNAVVRRMIARWNAAGAAVRLRELRRMPPSHDIIEPERCVALAERVFPEILDAIDPEGERAG